MTANRDHLWQAYLDGEMSACESSEFENTLCENGRKRLDGEVLFEAACRDKLCEPICCPDELWNTLKTKIKNDSSATPNNVTRFPRHRKALFTILGTAAAAAVLVITLRPNATNASLTEPTNHPVLSTVASIDSVNQYLRDFNVPVQLDHTSIANSHHAIKLVGARESSLNGTTVKEVYYTCCGDLVEMIIAKNGTPAAAAFAAENNASHIQATRTVAGHTIALLSHHPSTELLNVFATAR